MPLHCSRHSPRFPHLAATLLALVAAASLHAATPAPRDLPAVIEYNRDIRPVMSNTCFKCHGADVKSNQANLRLDLAEHAYRPLKDAAGRARTPIVPYKPEQSEVWRRLSSADPAVRMPPPDSLHQVTPRDRLLIKRWIEQGAKYQAHWAYVAPQKVALPELKSTAGLRHPIDGFIRAELEKRRLTPSPEADRRTLIRRLSLDLTGLPPTPDEVEAFVADASAGAYERVVDRLLASPHYGERMAVPWLDLVRFADSIGFHADQSQNIFPYRDYVIDAFNRNKPFDQFTLEQLAGDLLPNPTVEQRIATGFNRLNMMTREGGAQPNEYLAKYAADRVRAVSTVWLGSTVGCAECHDHKYDPISTKDFYALAAYFGDVKQYGVYQNFPFSPNPELQDWTDDHPFPPEIEVESEALKRRLTVLHARTAERARTVGQSILKDEAHAKALRTWVGEVAPRLAADSGGWSIAAVEKAEPAPNVVAEILPDHSVRFNGGVAKEDWKDHLQVLTLDAASGPLASVRVEALPDEKHNGLVARHGEQFFRLRLSLALRRAGATETTPLDIADAYSDRETGTYFNGRVVTSLAKNWSSAPRFARERQATTYLLKKPVTLAPRDRIVATVRSRGIGRVRLAVSPLGGRLPTQPLTAEERAAFAATTPSLTQLELLAANYFLSTGQPDAARHVEALRDIRQIAAAREGRAFTMVTVATTPRPTRVLPRGNWQDESGELVAPDTLHFLPKLTPQNRASTAAPTAQTRADLARWLTSRENPLTARTFANRLWKQFFGAGLSAVVDDLGAQGEWPSHPELLDWLAVEFMDRGWDVKALVRLIVTSATYRQESKLRPELSEIDPDNRLLARQSRRRLDAEFVRDNALAAAGLLNPALGGPSAHPYQPDGYYAAMNFPPRDYDTDFDDLQYRRGVYMHWQRTFLHPMLANFDAPSREECTAARTQSSTPQQALTLLNDPVFVEAARTLAEQVLAVGPDASFAAKLDSAHRRVVARPPTDRVRASLARFYEEQLTYFRANPADARKLTSVGLRPVPAKLDRVELAAWTSLARVLLNLNEAIVIY